MDSLLSPQDRGDVSSSSFDVNVSQTPPLGQKDMQTAFDTLNKNVTFTQVDRRYADPPLLNQKIALVSFIPSKTAIPDKDGIYGMMKVRGTFATEQEANEYAEHIVRNVDSLHEIYHAWVGRPFPITTSTGFEKEIKTIDIRKKTIDLISEDILSKRQQDEKDLKDIQEKEKRLLDESKNARENLPQDPFDLYITEQVKRAQLIWTYKETAKKMSQMRDIVNRANHDIREIEKEHPDFITQYKEKYMKARRDAGIPDDDESFIKYLGIDNIDHVFDDQIL